MEVCREIEELDRFLWALSDATLVLIVEAIWGSLLKREIQNASVITAKALG
jgi:hypothetical protein